MMSSAPNYQLLQGRMPRRSLGPRLSLSTKYMASTWMLLKDFHHTIIPVAVIKKRNFSLKTKTVFELSFTSLSLQKQGLIRAVWSQLLFIKLKIQQCKNISTYSNSKKVYVLNGLYKQLGHFRLIAVKVLQL